MQSPLFGCHLRFSRLELKFNTFDLDINYSIPLLLTNVREKFQWSRRWIFFAW